MNEHQRHKIEYLFHLLDDEDVTEAGLVLSGQYDRRKYGQRYHMINDRRKHPLTLTPLRILILTTCMACVTVASLLVISIAPATLFNIPVFFAYCAAIVIARSKAKPMRLQSLRLDHRQEH